MAKQTLVTELLEKLTFLPPEARRRIEQQFKQLPPAATEELVGLLRHAVVDQDEVLRLRVSKDPEFAEKLGAFLQANFQLTAREVEAEERKNVDSLLSD
jgi:hypothetical protein